MSAFKLFERMTWKKKLDSVYECSIYVKTEEINNGIVVKNGIPYVNIKSIGKFVKNTMVFKKQDTFSNIYINLKTGEKYRIFDVCDAKIGEMYIDLKKA